MPAAGAEGGLYQSTGNQPTFDDDPHSLLVFGLSPTRPSPKISNFEVCHAEMLLPSHFTNNKIKSMQA
jgi:hypothetical protein